MNIKRDPPEAGLFFCLPAAVRQDLLQAPGQLVRAGGGLHAAVDALEAGDSLLGGCSGNLQGIASLVRGKPAEEAIRRLKGIRCGFKDTSCPDQFARNLEKAMAEERA